MNRLCRLRLTSPLVVTDCVRPEAVGDGKAKRTFHAKVIDALPQRVRVDRSVMRHLRRAHGLAFLICRQPSLHLQKCLSPWFCFHVWTHRQQPRCWGLHQGAVWKGSAHAIDQGGYFGADQPARDVKHPQFDRAIVHAPQALVTRHRRGLQRRVIHEGMSIRAFATLHSLLFECTSHRIRQWVQGFLLRLLQQQFALASNDLAVGDDQ